MRKSFISVKTLAIMAGLSAGTASLLVPSASSAAARTVQFSGLAVLYPSYLNFPADVRFDKATTRAVCQIVVTNLGAAAEKVTNFTAMDFNNAGGDLATVQTFTTNVAGTVNFKSRLSSAGGTAANCMNVAIAQNQYCVFRYETDTMDFDEKQAVCSGRITVEDNVANNPGSLVAAGAIGYVQEVQVLGGILSSALYLSGSPLPRTGTGAGTAGIDTTMTSVTPSNFASRDTFNMNAYCVKSCMAQSANYAKVSVCEQYCGLRRNNESAILDGTSGSATDGGSANFDPLYAQSLSAIQLTPADDSANVSNRLTSGSPHFSGGLVYEMTTGPLRSICSANKGYASQNGSTLTHPSTSRMTGTEALYCAHRHSMDDLFMGVGTSSPFVINGGNPF